MEQPLYPQLILKSTDVPVGVSGLASTVNCPSYVAFESIP